MRKERSEWRPEDDASSFLHHLEPIRRRFAVFQEAFEIAWGGFVIISPIAWCERNVICAWDQSPNSSSYIPILSFRPTFAQNVRRFLTFVVISFKFVYVLFDARGRRFSIRRPDRNVICLRTRTYARGIPDFSMRIAVKRPKERFV